ncbi:MAG: type II toxin-antitoxin system VapC family toxin [Nitrososphaerales archaeon]
MKELKVYLDSSAIVKRYVEEPGSVSVKAVYKKADVSEALLIFSLWNVGEVLGVLDSYMKRNLLSSESLARSLNDFAGETLRLTKLMTLEVLPLTFDLLSEACKIVLQYHIYQADAIQIVAAKSQETDIFLSADQRLLGVVVQENMNAMNVELEEEKILRML